MKARGITRKSVKEQELNNFIHRKLLTHPATIITNELDIIKQKVTEYKGVPVKAVFINKKRVSFELIELRFGEEEDHFFTEITWEEWYEIFKTQQLQFIFVPPSRDGKHDWFYKLTK